MLIYNINIIGWREYNEEGRTQKREYFQIVNQSPNLALSSPTYTVCPGDTMLSSANSVSATSYNWNYGQLNPISGMITIKQ